MHARTATTAIGVAGPHDSTFGASVRFRHDDGPQMDGAMPPGWWLVPMMAAGVAFWVGIGFLILG